MSFTHRSKSLEAEGMTPHSHETTAQMRECEDQWERDIEGQAQANAELETERQYELWLEGGGAATEAIAADFERERWLETMGGF